MLTYNFISHQQKIRFFLNKNLKMLAETRTKSNYFQGAITGEREIYDMFGIFFIDHPDSEEY